MKKRALLFLAVLMVSMAALGAFAMAETVLKQAIYPAHGTRAFCIATVAMDGDVITAVLLEEFQFMGEGSTPVPNPEAFTNADGNILGAKRVNNAFYSANMAERGEATQELVASYIAIEEFCVGKTVAEIEAAIEGKTAEDMADVVTSSTLVDTLGYLQAVIEAAK